MQELNLQLGLQIDIIIVLRRAAVDLRLSIFWLIMMIGAV